MKCCGFIVAMMVFWGYQGYGAGMYYEKSGPSIPPLPTGSFSSQNTELAGNEKLNRNLMIDPERFPKPDSTNQARGKETEERRKRTDHIKKYNQIQIISSCLGFLSTIGYYFYLDAVGREVVFTQISEDSRWLPIFVTSFFPFLVSVGSYVLSYKLFSQRGEEPFLAYLFSILGTSLLIPIFYLHFKRIILKNFFFLLVFLGIILIALLLSFVAGSFAIIWGNIKRTNSWLKLKSHKKESNEN